MHGKSGLHLSASPIAGWNIRYEITHYAQSVSELTKDCFMARARSLQDEVSQLRSDSTKDHSKRKRRAKAAPPDRLKDVEAAQEQATTVDTEKLKDLTGQLNELVHSAEDGIKDHPVATVLGAFALGILVGAALRR